MKKALLNSITLLFIIFSFHVNALEKTHKPINGINSKNDTENTLLARIKENPKDSESLAKLGAHYFNLAHEAEARYLWGTPKKEKTEKKITNNYAKKALDYLEKAVEINPKDATSITKIANSYGMMMRVGGFGAKLKYLKQFRKNLRLALEIDPKNRDARISEAFRILYTPSLVSNRVEKAKEQFDALFKEYPNDPEVIKGLAIVNKRQDNFEKAYELINSVLSIKQGDLESISLKSEIKNALDKERKKKEK